MTNLGVRALTALLGATIIIAGIVYSPWTFAAVFIIILLLTLKEFYQLARNAGSAPFELWGAVFSLTVFTLLFLNLKGEVEAEVFWMLPALFATVFIYPLMRLGRMHAINCLSISLLGVLYAALPFCLVLPIAFLTGEFRYELVVGILFIQWATDSGAFFAGKAFGKTKLFERVSPKKTWEGAIGGLLLALAMAYAMSYYFDIISMVEWLGLALLISVFGTIGDLTESLFKRTLAVKDSGSSIPGHGGFLDRFDGLILVLPFALTYLHLIH